MKILNWKEFWSFFNPKLNWRALTDVDTAHIHSFDTLRAAAMLWIVCKHSVQIYFDRYHPANVRLEILQNPMIRPIMMAEFGVDIFFVISGFLIAGILLKELKSRGEINVRLFYIRRTLRMVPIYYFLLFAFVTFRWFDIVPYLWTKKDAWPNFLYLTNFVAINDMFMTHTWSLAVEEQFYFLCPLLIVFAVRKKISISFVFYLIIILSIVIHYFILTNNEWKYHWMPLAHVGLGNHNKYFDLIYDKPYVRFASLMIGALGSYYRMHGFDIALFKTRARKIATLSVGFILIFLVFLTRDYTKPLSTMNEIFYREVFAIGFVLIMLSSIHIATFKQLFSSKYFYPVFQLSYGIYLIHYPLQYYFYKNISLLKLLGDLTIEEFFYSAVLIGVLTFIISGLINLPVYLFIERPFMNLREKWFPAK